MQRLSQHNKTKLLDLLGARCTFERAGVKLYDAIITKIERTQDARFMPIVGALREHRAEEKEHEEWLEAQIRSLGGDPHATTEMSQLIQTESLGLEKVILDGDPNIGHLFHALLAAELVDNSGWELLIELAVEADDDEARRAFKKCLHEEREHLILMRRAVEDVAKHEVLGQVLEVPSSP